MRAILHDNGHLKEQNDQYTHMNSVYDTIVYYFYGEQWICMESKGSSVCVCTNLCE